MAAAVHKLLHPHRSRDQARDEEHERQNSAIERARDEEKHTLAQWGDKKAPLEPGQIDKDPSQKMVGHSSNVLRKEDFELIKTLGTGECAGPALRRMAGNGADGRQAPLRASGW